MPEGSREASSGPGCGPPLPPAFDRSTERTGSLRDRSGENGRRGADGTGRSRRPGAPGSPSVARAPRDAAPLPRVRRSGGQPLAAARAASGQDSPAPGGPHPGAEAVLLGAMALLWLVGLLHRGCARSSPSRPRVRRCYRPLKARERAGRTQAHGAFDVRPDYGTRQEGCQTWRHRPWGPVGRSSDPPAPSPAGPIRRATHGYSLGVSGDSCPIALRGPDGRCYPSRAVGAGKRGGSLWRTSGGAPGADRRRPAERAETSHATVPPSPRPWPTIPIDQPIR